MKNRIQGQKIFHFLGNLAGCTVGVCNISKQKKSTAELRHEKLLFFCISQNIEALKCVSIH